ncbi:MAG: flavodoxin family protein [Anaerolineae bacterium]|jgi:multimeric flavodoxin WrbA
MTKILGVVGSPRKKGNTHILVSTILEGAAAEGANTETLFLRKMKIRECDSCHACWEGKRCSRRDDMNEAYSLISESNAIVLGTPVYWYGPTALMEAFIDRFVYLNCSESRAQVRGKRAIIVVPYEEKGPEAAELLVAFFERSLAYLEMDLVGQILAPGVGRRGAILEREELLARARDLGGTLARGNSGRRVA